MKKERIRRQGDAKFETQRDNNSVESEAKSYSPHLLAKVNSI